MEHNTSFSVSLNQDNFQDSQGIVFLEKYGDIGKWLLPTITGLSAYFQGHHYIPLGIICLGLGQKYIVDTLKDLFPRPRPRPFYFGKISQEDLQSFPSSHTSGAFLSAGLSYGLYGLSNQTITLIALSALVGLSRVLSQKHWISDVTAGAALGFSAGWLCGRVFG